MILQRCEHMNANITATTCAKNKASGKYLSCEKCDGVPGDPVITKAEKAKKGKVDKKQVKAVTLDLVAVIREEFDRRRDEAISKITAVSDPYQQLDAAWQAVCWARSRT
jgi:hypothetical protein